MSRITAAIVGASEWLAGAGVLVCVGINLVQVACRYFFYVPLPWSEEVMRYAMVWVAMLGAVAALGRRELPAVDLFAGLKNTVLRRALAIAAALSVCIFCVTLIIAGWPTLKRAFRAVSPAAEIPLHYPYLAVFVGSALMMLLAIIMILQNKPISGDTTDG